MKYTYIFINKKDIEALQNLLAPLGYNKQPIKKIFNEVSLCCAG